VEDLRKNKKILGYVQEGYGPRFQPGGPLDLEKGLHRILDMPLAAQIIRLVVLYGAGRFITVFTTSIPGCPSVLRGCLQDLHTHDPVKFPPVLIV
jgi:hypothetical protein